MLLYAVNQWQVALIAAEAGLALGLVYQLLRLVRYSLRNRWWTALWDLVFWAVAAAAVLYVLWRGCEGELRAYPLLCMALGVGLYAVGPGYGLSVLGRKLKNAWARRKTRRCAGGQPLV